MKKDTITITLDYRWVSLALLAVIAGMLLLWRPWQAAAGQRTISVTGQATVKAEPDEYQFYPTYERPTTTELTSLSESIVAQLKVLGVPDSGIKNNASRYGMYYPVTEGDKQSSLSLTITVGDKALAQKVQDYLLTTDPSGSITPQPAFSTAKQKQLRDQARDQAVVDARKNAQKLVAGLGARLGAVQNVSEGQNYGGVMPMMGAAEDKATSSSQTITVQPGKDEYSYEVSVTYALR